MESDIQILRRRLLLLGFALLEVRGGYLIQHFDFKSIRAGTEAKPLSLSQVKRFAA